MLVAKHANKEGKQSKLVYMYDSTTILTNSYKKLKSCLFYFANFQFGHFVNGYVNKEKQQTTHNCQYALAELCHASTQCPTKIYM